MTFFWESDPFSPIEYHYKNLTLLHEEQSEFQTVQIYDHPFFGRMLVLDGVVQLTQRHPEERDHLGDRAAARWLGDSPIGLDCKGRTFQ